MAAKEHEDFIKQVKLGIGHTEPLTDSGTNTEIIECVDWVAVKLLADKQGLSAIVLDGIDKLPDIARPPKDLLMEWIGETLQNYEIRYESYRRTIAEMAAVYDSLGYKMMVLKGYACSLDWIQPKHRPCGDIDIWLFGKQKEADAALEGFKFQDSSFKIDTSHHHHTVFLWGDFTVENHYDFVNVHAHKSSAELEKIFKEMGQDDTHFVEIKGAKVYLPSPNLHALFLIKHMVSHFAAAEISLRQVLDWAFFVEKHIKEIDWEWLLDVLEKYHMKEFFNLINGICVDNLGFSADLFPEVRFLPDLKDRVLNDILEPAYPTAEPNSLIPRLLYKFRRWQGNAWKHELCYDESRWENFWTGLRAHIIKPTIA